MGQLNGNGNENTPNVIKNKYLNLDGLFSFWNKVKGYILEDQAQQTKNITNAYRADDDSIREFISEIKINKKPLATYTAGTDFDDNGYNNKGTLALEKDFTIYSNDVPLTETTSNTLKGNAAEGPKNVDDGLVLLAGRMTDVEDALLGDVVTKLTVEHIPSGEESTDDLITFTAKKENNGTEVLYDGTGSIVLTLDHTNLNDRITALDALDAEFANYSINGQPLFDNIKKEAIDAVLTGADITRGAGNTDADKATIADTFTNLETKIAALSSATEFQGVVAWDPTKVTITAEEGTDVNGSVQYKITGTVDNVVPDNEIMQNGDIIIYGQKEYILDGAQLVFVELGDTTAEQAQLTEIQDWINAPITEEEINKLFEEDENQTT